MNNVNAKDNLALYRRMMAIRGRVRERLSAACPGGVGREALGALMREMAGPHEPVGLACALIHRGRTAAVLTMGEAVLGEKPVDARTKFRVHSISKMIGNMGVMRLIEEGALDLDADVSDYLGYGVRHPDAPGVPVTLRQIMTHTTGLHDNGDYLKMGTDAMLNLSDFFKDKAAARRNFTPHLPGTQYGYSNLGTGMMGALIEKITGRDYDAVLQARVFEPLKLDASFHPARIRAQADMANIYRHPDRALSYDAHAIAAAPMEDWPDPERHYTTAPGRLMIAPADLCTLMRVILQGGAIGGVTIIEPESMAAMLARQSGVASVACDAQRGLNVMIAERSLLPSGRVAHGHQGSAYGAISEAFVELATQNGVVMATSGVWTRTIRPLARVGHDILCAMFAALDYMDEKGMEFDNEGL